MQGRRIGVEVMEYHRDFSSDGESELRHREAQIGALEKSFSTAMDDFPNLHVYGQVFFRRSEHRVGGVTPDYHPMLPPKKDYKRFVCQLLEFASGCKQFPRDGIASFSVFPSGFDLLKKYVEHLELEQVDYWVVWLFDPKAKAHGFATEQWIGHLRHKTERISKAREQDPHRFDEIDELWLLLVSGPRSSGSVAATLNMFRVLNDEARRSPFQKILIDECWEEGKMWCWCRDQGGSERVHHPDD